MKYSGSVEAGVDFSYQLSEGVSSTKHSHMRDMEQRDNQIHGYAHHNPSPYDEGGGYQQNYQYSSSQSPYLSDNPPLQHQQGYPAQHSQHGQFVDHQFGEEYSG